MEEEEWGENEKEKDLVLKSLQLKPVVTDFRGYKNLCYNNKRNSALANIGNEKKKQIKEI